MNYSDDNAQDRHEWRKRWILGFALVILIGVLLLLLPTLSRTYELAKRSMCMANLNSIGKGIALYRYDHNDLPPPNLAAIVHDGQPVDLLRCPSSETKKCPTTQTADIESHCDYIYAPLPEEEKESLLMAFELPRNHRQRTVNVLFNDYRVESVEDMGKFVSLVRELNDYHAELRRQRP